MSYRRDSDDGLSRPGVQRDRAPATDRERDYDNPRSDGRDERAAGRDRSRSPQSRDSKRGHAAETDETHSGTQSARTKKPKQLSWLKKPAAASNDNAAITSTNHDRRTSAEQPQSTKPAAAAEVANTNATPAPAVYVKQVKLKTVSTPDATAAATTQPPPKPSSGKMIEVLLNDRLGSKARVKCNSDDTIGILKKLAAAQLGTRPEKLRLQKWHTVYKDHIRLDDYEISDGMSLELHYM